MPVNRWMVLLLMMSVVGACFLASFAEAGESEVQNITLLSKLSPMENTSWVSPSKNFALGFSPVANNAYLLSIWFNSIPVKTIVWSANRDRLVTSAATLEFTRDGNLVLNDSQRTIVWESNTSNLNVINVEMKDTGNFVLLSKSSQSVWESFNNPTDTLLPDQPLKQGLSLISQQSPISPASGNYVFTLQPVGQLKLYNRQVFPDASSWYWPPKNYNHSESAAPTPSTVWTVRTDGQFGLFNGTDGATIWAFITPDYELQPPRRLTLDVDGNLRMYSWDSSSGSWLQMWKAVKSECEIDGRCGPYGVCSPTDPLIMGAPRCFCPPGFHAVNPHDSLLGCSRTQPLGCSRSNSSKFATLEKTDFPGKYDYPDNKTTISQLDCTQLCSNDCNCTGAAYHTDGSGKCYPKQGGLINGQTRADISVRFLVKVAISQALPPSTHISAPSLDRFAETQQPQITQTASNHSRSSRTKRDIAIAAVSSSAVSASLVVFILTCLLFYTKRQTRPQVSGSLCYFSYKELETATKSFSETLGSGGFGSVYKGLLPDLGYVAVKKLDKLHHQGEREFRAEVETIGSIHHMNLVRLHGFCSEGSHRLLVYEYLSHGSLDKFMFQNSPSKKQLEWSVRLKIAVGTARAIAYLHEECRKCIIHCDIKPQNILLDDRFTPIVSDFGLAKLLQKDQTRTFTTIRGTRGYVAPEWISNNAITVKADVYSYGVVLLELLMGRRNFELASTRWDFGEWAIQQVEKGKLQDVAEEAFLKLAGTESQLRLQQVERVVKVALLCIQDDPSLRPTMGKVVQMLEGTMEVLDLPMSKSISSECIDSSMHQLSSSHSATMRRAVQMFEVLDPHMSKSISSKHIDSSMHQLSSSHSSGYLHN